MGRTAVHHEGRTTADISGRFAAALQGFSPAAAIGLLDRGLAERVARADSAIQRISLLRLKECAEVRRASSP